MKCLKLNLGGPIHVIGLLQGRPIHVISPVRVIQPGGSQQYRVGQKASIEGNTLQGI